LMSLNGILNRLNGILNGSILNLLNSHLIRKWFVKWNNRKPKKMWNKCDGNEKQSWKYLWWNYDKQNKNRTNPTPQKQWDNNEKLTNRHQPTNLNKSFNTSHENHLKFELCLSITKSPTNQKQNELSWEWLNQKRTTWQDWPSTKIKRYQESSWNQSELNSLIHLIEGTGQWWRPTQQSNSGAINTE
jgi:hypothetical protein